MMWPSRIAAADRLHANAVPFPFGDVVGGIEVGKIRILDRMRQHHRAERRRIEIDRLLAAPFQPREQIEIGRREAGPDQFDLVSVLAAERRRRGFGQAARKCRSASRRSRVSTAPSGRFRRDRRASVKAVSAFRSCRACAAWSRLRSGLAAADCCAADGSRSHRYLLPTLSRLRGRYGYLVGSAVALRSDLGLAVLPGTAECGPPPLSATLPLASLGEGGVQTVGSRIEHFSATSARPSPRDRRHNRTTAQTGSDRCARR